MNGQTSDLLRRISKYVFIGVAALLVLLLLLALFRVSIGFWLWSTVETWATVRLGLDSDAAQLVTVVLVSLITLLLPTLAWYFLWGKKQLYATGAVVGGQILIFLLVSTVGSGVCFDRQTGKPLCWYADIPSKGRVFSRTEGFDPATGIKFEPYTREVASSSAKVQVTPQTSATVSKSSSADVLRQNKYEFGWTGGKANSGDSSRASYYLVTDVSVSGNSVTVNYAWKNGILQGTLSGRDFTGTWKQSSGNDVESGKMNLRFDESFSKAEGSWTDFQSGEIGSAFLRRVN